MQNTPFNGAGRRPAPHPLLATFPSPTAIYLYTLFYPLCVEYVCVVLYKNMLLFMRKVKVPGRDAQAGRVDSLPPPPPCSVGGAVGGGRVGEPCSAWGFWAGKGGSLASKFDGSYSRVDLACFHGKTFWRIYLVGQFGTFIWRVFMSNGKDVLLSKKRKEKEMSISSVNL